MIGKLLAASAVAALLAGLAFPSIDQAAAADLVFKPSEPVAPVEPPFDWSGPYLGLHAGGGWGREDDDQSRLFRTNNVSSNDSFDMNGFVGGAHAGYDYQFLPSNFVLGVEGDLDYTSLKGSHHAGYAFGFLPRTLEMKSEWQASARLRAGYAFDNFLLYTTGGIAFADGKLTNSGNNFGMPIPTTSSSKTHVGWTVGLGSEYAFTPNWIGRAEVRYTDFDKQTYTTADGPVKAGWDQVTGTLGVSYKF